MSLQEYCPSSVIIRAALLILIAANAKAQPTDSDMIVQRLREAVEKKELNPSTQELTLQLVEGGPAAVQSIQKALKHSAPPVRYHLVSALARIITPEAELLKLQVALGDPDENVAATAATTLVGNFASDVDLC